MTSKELNPDFSDLLVEDSVHEAGNTNKPSENETNRLSELKRLKIKFYSNVGLNIYDQDKLNTALKSEKRFSQKTKYMEGTAWRSHAAIKQSVFSYLEILKSRFANFTGVLEAIEGELRLECLGDKPIVTFTPKLLLGPPGVGKTRFCSELAKALGIPFYSKSLATMTAGFVLSGMSDCWSDARPGFISTVLLNGCIANPLIFFDEIDKSHADSRFETTMPLLALFEHHSAEQFEDEYFELEFNASGMNFMATAKDASLIPEAVLSRLDVFNIEIPDAAQSRSIVNSIYSEILSQHRWGKYFNGHLNEEIQLYLSELPPRNIRQKILSACANAARGRDKPIQLRSSDFEKENKHKPKPGIGFLANHSGY